MKNGYPIFKGQMPILPTTVTDGGEIDVESQKNLVDYLLENNACAIGHLGGASEYFKVSQRDREVIIATIVERVNKRVPVFIGNTCVSVGQSVDNAKIAERMGADMLMVCSPIYGSLSAAQLFDYYRAVADAVSLPIIVQDTGASSDKYSAEFIAKLAREIPTVGYAKTEGKNFLERACRLMELAGDDIQVIGGAAGFHMIQLLRRGVLAYMTGTEAADIHGGVISAYLSGDVDRAVSLYYTTLLPYLELFNLNNRPMLKYMLHKRGVLVNQNPVPPASSEPMSDIMLEEFEWIWRRIVENRIAGNTK